MEYEAILQKTLGQMKAQFTSNAFCARARRNGLPEQVLHKGAHLPYILQFCNSNGGKRSWVKTGSPKANSEAQQPLTLFEGLTEKICIDFLKSFNGKYRILISGWEEI